MIYFTNDTFAVLDREAKCQIVTAAEAKAAIERRIELTPTQTIVATLPAASWEVYCPLDDEYEYSFFQKFFKGVEGFLTPRPVALDARFLKKGDTVFQYVFGEWLRYDIL